MDYNRIIAHTDFDGVSSAVLCSLKFNIGNFMFANPSDINYRKFPVYDADIIVDLPYSSPAALWYDHHSGNIEDLIFQKIDPALIAGIRREEKSCARIIYDEFMNDYPPFIAELVAAADKIDSFDYKDLEELRQETPARIVDCAMKIQDTLRERNIFLLYLVQQLSKISLDELSKFSEIYDFYKTYLDDEERMLNIIDKEYKVVELKFGKLILLDFSEYKHPPRILKNLAFLKEPQSKIVIAINPVFKNNIKTTELSLTLSLSLNVEPNIFDLGDIVRELNIGDGHKGASAGRIVSKNKEQMLKQKEMILGTVYKMLNQQGVKGINSVN